MFFILVQLCKERWKNLRTVFLRHINQRKIKNQATGGFKRKYYLEDSMQFILPFLKGGRQQRGNLTTTSTMEQDLVNLNEDNPNDYLDVGLMEESELGQSETYNDTKIESSEAQNSDRTEPTTSTGRRADFNWYRTKNYYNNKEEGYDEDKCSIEYFEATEKNITRAATECADQKFLLSLLPDMKQMNFKQKRKFKREILDVIDRILED